MLSNLHQFNFDFNIFHVIILIYPILYLPSKKNQLFLLDSAPPPWNEKPNKKERNSEMNQYEYLTGELLLNFTQ